MSKPGPGPYRGKVQRGPRPPTTTPVGDSAEAQSFTPEEADRAAAFAQMLSVREGVNTARVDLNDRSTYPRVGSHWRTADGTLQTNLVATSNNAGKVITDRAIEKISIDPAKTETAVPKRILQKEMELEGAIEENLLDQFDSPSYHFRLFMMPESVGREGGSQGYDRYEQIVIAQTASSSIGIDDVTITTMGGISKEAGTGTATKFTFTLKQPFGVSLLDIIESSARRLGISNWTKAPFYLELSFRARDRDTSRPIVDGPLNQQVWVWPLLFTTTSIAVNTGGSVYNVEAVHTGDRAYTNEVSDLDQVESIPVGTVGDFFEELANRLNKSKNDLREDEERSSFDSHMDEYRFYVSEDIAKESIILDHQESKPGRSGPFDIDADLKEITFHLNTSVDRMVDSIMSMTSYFQTSVTGEETPDVSDEAATDKEKVQFTKMWRVIADSRIKGYDSIRNDYSHIYRYLIIPYEVPTIRNPAKEQTDVAPKEIISVLRRRGTLKKAYDYLFTGLNDQVLDFDIKFNFHWYAALPLNQGLHNSGDSVGLPQSGAVIVPADDPETRKAGFNDASTVRWAAAASGIDTQNSSNLTGFTSAADLRNRFGGPRPGGPPYGATDAEIAEHARSLPRDDGGIIQEGPLRGLPRTPFTNDSVNQFSGRPSREITSLTSMVKKTPAGPTPRPASGIVPGFPRFAEDLFEDEQSGKIARIPVSYRKESHGRENLINAEGEQNRGKTLLSALFEQARSPAAADLLSIELKVKGDPYWLEPGPVGTRSRPMSTLERELQRRGMEIRETDGSVVQVPESAPVVTADGAVISSASTTTDQTFFVFRLHTPQSFDNNTGLMEIPTTNNMLNGLYGVFQTVHEFTEGKFTQTLTSVRMLDLDLTAELIEDLYRGESIRKYEQRVLQSGSSTRGGRRGGGRKIESDRTGTDGGAAVDVSPGAATPSVSPVEPSAQYDRRTNTVTIGGTPLDSGDVSP